MSKHSKKRNTGLLYEFLINHISTSLVEGTQKQQSKALRILKKHFVKGCELYNEWRLINALLNTKVSSEAVAANIIQEAKLAAQKYDVSKLNHQKSLLIRDINHIINEATFYDQHVNDYKIIATIQMLINEWRSNDKNIALIATFEDQVIKHLTTQKEQTTVEVNNTLDESSGTCRLLVKTMMNKLNDKYKDMLPEQKDLLRTYSFAVVKENNSIVKNKLVLVKEKLLEKINTYVNEHSSEEFIIKQLSEAKQKLLSENLEQINDNSIAKFMLYIKLISELSAE